MCVTDQGCQLLKSPERSEGAVPSRNNLVIPGGLRGAVWSELGTCETVNARFWPCLSVTSPSNQKSFPLHSRTVRAIPESVNCRIPVLEAHPQSAISHISCPENRARDVIVPRSVSSGYQRDTASRGPARRTTPSVVEPICDTHASHG